jgi:hypothetical protein
MKQFINIFGVTSILEVSYINAYDVKENAISHAVRAMQGEATSRTESVLMNDQTLLRKNLWSGVGKLIL